MEMKDLEGEGRGRGEPPQIPLKDVFVFNYPCLG